MRGAFVSALSNGENRSALVLSVLELFQKYPSLSFFWTGKGYFFYKSYFSRLSTELSCTIDSKEFF